MLRLLLVLSAALAQAADAKLDALSATLVAIRGSQAQDLKSGAPRGATAKLTTAKHQLRDWIESRLPELPRSENPGAFEAKLNADLRSARLVFDWDNFRGTDAWSIQRLGYTDPVRVQARSVFLVVITSLGIECGRDESAYIYGWSDEGWRRVWQNEQNDYTAKGYKPQALTDVVISRGSGSNNYVALTLGFETWCSSNWHDVYYRAFRLGGDPMAGPLLDGSDWANVAFDPPIRGSVTPERVLVEYHGRSIDGGIVIRTHVRQFRLEDWRARRVPPIALSPRHFVDEWLSSEWLAAWSEGDHRRALRDEHTKRHQDSTFGEFTEPTLHCPSTPDLWQVGVDFGEPTARQSPQQVVYFLVRWRPPYNFSMVNVSDTPFKECTEEDRDADDESRTMFP